MGLLGQLTGLRFRGILGSDFRASPMGKWAGSIYVNFQLQIYKNYYIFSKSYYHDIILVLE